MAFEQINRGATANDGTGDNLREAFRKVNDNFDKALEEVTTSGVERVYTINADGSQGTKATSELGGGKEVVLLQNRWTLTTSGTYYRSRGDFAGFNDQTISTISTGTTNYSTLSQANRSLSSSFFVANGAKKIDKIYVDVGQASLDITSFTFMFVACQRVASTNSNTSTINPIDLGEYNVTKLSTEPSTFATITPNDVTIPDGYVVMMFVKRNTGTGTELNCSVNIHFKNA